MLYFPTTPQDGRENLFTYLFKLLLRKQIKAYDYKLDGNENFSEKNEVSAKEIMDRYHIFYESKGDKVRVNDADIPSDEVKAYFVKESTYYDQHTATFRSQVTAICPVLKRGDSDFGGELAQYPMFWLKMSDVAPYLGKLMLMGSSLNNAATKLKLKPNSSALKSNLPMCKSMFMVATVRIMHVCVPTLWHKPKLTLLLLLANRLAIVHDVQAHQLHDALLPRVAQQQR